MSDVVIIVLWGVLMVVFGARGVEVAVRVIARFVARCRGSNSQ